MNPQRTPRAEKLRDWRHNDRPSRPWNARPPIRPEVASHRDA